MKSKDAIVHRSYLHRFVLAQARATRPKFTRVSEEFIERADAHLRVWVKEQLHALPSIGKTVK